MQTVDDSLSVPEAVWHYFFGERKPITVDFREVDIGLQPVDFPGYDDFVKSMYKKKVDLNIDLRISKDIGGWAGHVTYRLKGILNSTKHKWKFEGYIGAFSDKFDFNELPPGTRDWWKEKIVTITREYLPVGDAYWIHFRGQSSVRDGGSWL